VNQDTTLLATLALSFQTLGVVYGDLGTSPLYVFDAVFSKVPIESDVDVLGALSLVMHTIALLPLIVYVFIVLKANDNGEGKQKICLRSYIVNYKSLTPDTILTLAPCHVDNDNDLKKKLKLTECTVVTRSR
jgi:K+ transporter